MTGRKNASLFRQAGELPDYEEPDWDGSDVITEWETCPIHGDFPKGGEEVIDDGMRMCPICYIREIEARKNCSTYPKCLIKHYEHYSVKMPCVECTIRSDSLRSKDMPSGLSALGGGEEEADEECPSGKPLGNSPNINGGLVEDLDPGLQSILKHRKRS